MAATFDASRLAEAVRRKDYTAQLAARQAGGAAVVLLAPLITDPDEEVRQLAVYCLAETRDARAGEPLGKAVLDGDSQVAMAAARALHHVGGPRLVPELLIALPRAGEPMVRRELALVLGRFAGPDKIPELSAILAREVTGEARQGLVAALARMGDADSRDKFARELIENDGMARKPWLELAEYIGQPWLLRPLADLLDDETPVVRVGVERPPGSRPGVARV